MQGWVDGDRQFYRFSFPCPEGIRAGAVLDFLLKDVDAAIAAEAGGKEQDHG